MPPMDETPFALQAAQHFHTDHTQITLQSQDVLDVITDLLSWFDEPFADSSAIPTFIVSRETGKHVKVALSGDGGDELFAGYRMYTGRILAFPLSKIALWLRRELIEPIINSFPDSRDNYFAGTDTQIEKARRIFSRHF